MATYTKALPGVLDYAIDWSAWLGVDTIATSAWEVDTGVTIDSDTNTDTVATVWISGGVIGTKYEAINTIETASGRTDRRYINISVVEAR